MRRVSTVLARTLAVGAVLFALTAPDLEAAIGGRRNRDSRWSQVIRRLVSVVLGDELSQPKP